MKQLKGIDENTVVNCPTEELSNKVLEIAKEAGCSPFLVNSMYCHYEKDTCYNLMNGTFSDIRYYKNIKDYTILPAEEFIKLNTMKQLPEKWAIKGDLPQEFYEWFNKLHNVDKGISYPYDNISASDIVFYPSTMPRNDCYISGVAPEGHQEITIEQWREAVKYGWKELKSDELITGGELEGYEAPFDMFHNIDGFAVKKGTIYQKAGDTNGYLPKGIGFDWVALPAEWVETWKPVYKAKEKKRVPKSGWVIQVVGGLGIPILDGSTSRPALFNTQADCIEWVKKNGMLEEFYTFLEVDYITEE